MNSFKCNIYLVAMAILATSCATNSTNEEVIEVEHPTTEEREPVNNLADPPPPPVDTIQVSQSIFEDMEPNDFLIYLMGKTDSGFISMPTAPDNWIQEKDIEQLIELIESKKPCAGVIGPNSQQLPPGFITSTLGTEALLMIDAYRNKTPYPHYKGSVEFGRELQPNPNGKGMILEPSKFRIKEVKNWWEGQQ